MDVLTRVGMRGLQLTHKNAARKMILAFLDRRQSFKITQADFKTLPANNFRFLLPIPRAQILANPKLGKNTGYVD